MVALISVWGLLGGCREQTTVPIDRNHAPETFLSSAPGDSQTSFYRVPLHWVGTDLDGQVVSFDVAVTESLPKEDEIEWRRTQRTDSLVIFRVEETREVLGHRFYVRAIDNEGKADPTPARVFFGARDNVPPVVTFLRAIGFGPNGERKTLTSSNPDFPTDTIPTGWGVSFAWTGSDGDVAIGPDGQVIQVGRVERFSHRLLPIESEFLGGVLTDTSATYGPDYFNNLPKGSTYALQVRAEDDAGLTGSGLVSRSFVWNRDPVSRIERCLRPGEFDSLACFSSGDSVFFNGDTLALGQLSDSLPSVRFNVTAYDPDPLGGDHQVSQMEWRSYFNGVFTIWSEIPVGGGRISFLNLRTADYLIMVRAVDRLDRVEGSPDSLIVFVNLKPRFVLQVGDSTQTPRPGDTPRLSEVANGLPVKFRAHDPDGGPGEMIEYSLYWEGPMGDPFYEKDVTPQNVKLVRLDAWYNVRNASPRIPFRVGTYRLTVVAADNAHPGGDSRGRRSNARVIEFRVVPG